MSIGECVFSKMAHMIFLKLLMKLGWLNKGKKLADFWGKKILFGDNAQKHPKNRGFYLKKNSPFMCRFLGVNRGP